MVFHLLFPAVLALVLEGGLPVVTVPPASPAEVEPDGSHPTGLFPRYQAPPAPPAELRKVSHRQAMVDTEHYFYEAYASEPADPKATWIARYVMLPEGIEGYRELDQVYLFSEDLSRKPKVIKPEELEVEAQSLRWKGRTFKLVDRRDLTTRP